MIRSFIIVFMMVIFTVVFSSIAVVASLFDQTGRVGHFIARIWAWLILKTCRVEIVAEGIENINKEASYIYICNHSSNLDIPAMVHAIPTQIRIVAKKELTKIPIFGPAIIRAGHISIDRQNHKSAIKSLDNVAERLSKGDVSFIIFAEGTRSLDGSIQPFKKGGFNLSLQSGLPIIPVSIVGSYEVMKKGSLRINSGMIKIIFGEPISPKKYSKRELGDFIKRTRSVVIENYHH